MKKKQFGKKLSLNKATIASLNMNAMRHPKGGIRPVITRETLNLADPICLSDVQCTTPENGCPVATDTCSCAATCLATCAVTCAATCAITCDPCDSVWVC